MSQFVPPAVPAELRPLRNWLVWRLLPQEGGGKPRKVPYYVSGPARPNAQGTDEDRALLATYDEAVAAVQRSQSWDRPYTGLGFAPLDGCGVVALDFDNCVDQFGEIAPHWRLSARAPTPRSAPAATACAPSSWGRCCRTRTCRRT